MSHKLWIFQGGAAPRRVVIYNIERKFPQDFIEIVPTTIAGPGAPAVAPGKPPGPVPMLALPSGELVTDSLSILEYLEDFAESLNLPSMRGSTPIERAKVRSLLGLIETVTLSIELAAVNGSVVFRALVEGQQSAGVERWLNPFVHKSLGRIEDIANLQSPYLVKLAGDDTEVTTADCALFATLQYASELWGLNLIEEHPRLKSFYDAFAQRRNAPVPENTWPQEMTAMTRKFIDY